MGNGDKRSRKGKRTIGTYGKTRPRPGKERKEKRDKAKAEAAENKG